VIRTRVGYAGGLDASPDYQHIGDHTETVQVDYDPRRLTYRQLLEIFWNSHDPTQSSWSRQYRHAVFFHDERQRQQALDAKTALEKRIGRSVQTEVVPLNTFTMAEAYHQKYLLKQHHDLSREMARIYPRHPDLVDSTAAARLNGYVGGHGSPEQLAREIDHLGLGEAGQRALTEMVRRRSNDDRQ
jgi:methionine-S-sulfoxide reductase